MITTHIECSTCHHDLVRVGGPDGKLTCIECDGGLFMTFHRKSEDVAKFRKKLGTIKKAKSFDALIEELAEDFDSLMR